MHTPNGHINHFWESVSETIEKRMKGCAWQVQVTALHDQVAAKLCLIEEKIESANSHPVAKDLKSQLRRLRKSARQTKDDTERKTLEDRQESVLEELRDLSANSEIGNYNLIRAGIKEFEELINSKPKKKGK